MGTTRVVMPQLGESVHEGTISKWLVKPGEKVVEVEPLLEGDTDKVSAEVPAPVTGVLKEILAKEGQTVQAGAEIAVVELSDGKVSATPEAPAPAPKVAAEEPSAAPAAPAPAPKVAAEKPSAPPAAPAPAAAPPPESHEEGGEHR